MEKCNKLTRNATKHVIPVKNKRRQEKVATHEKINLIKTTFKDYIGHLVKQ